MDYLTEMATRHQVFLERLKTHTALDFASVVPRLEVGIVDILGALKDPQLSNYSRKSLKQLLDQLRDKQTQLILENNANLVSQLKKIGNSEGDYAGKQIGAVAARAGKRIDLETLPAGQAWKSAVAAPLNTTGQLLEPFIKGWGDRQVEAVNNLVQRGWAQGATVQQMVQAIRGTKKMNYTDGLMDMSRRQAEAVVRTSVQHVSNQAYQALWAANGDLVKRYRYVATLDRRTTPQCQSLDGQIFELGKGPVPPIHIGCRSTTVPELGKEFDFLDEGATRSSEKGYVDAKLSYYDWLKTQPKDFQDEALGKSRAQLFRDGGLTSEQFAKLNLGKNFAPMTLAQMQAKEPLVFEKAGVKAKDINPVSEAKAQERAARQAADEAKRQAENDRKAAEVSQKQAEAAARKAENDRLKAEEAAAKAKAAAEAAEKLRKEQEAAAKKKADEKAAEEKKLADLKAQNEAAAKALAQKKADNEKLKAELAKTEAAKKTGQAVPDAPKVVVGATKPGVKFQNLDGVKSASGTAFRNQGPITGLEREAMYTYVGAGYRDINGKLRGLESFGGLPDNIITNYIKSIDGLMQKSYIAENIQVYRGFKPMPGVNMDDLIGFTIQDKAFTSTTISKNVALNFARESPSSVIFKIKVPKNTNGIVMNKRLPDSLNGVEEEVLLPRNAKFRITKRLPSIERFPTYEVEIEPED